MTEQRYSMKEAERLLTTTQSTLQLWIKRAGLSEAIKRQRQPDDLREHWLTRTQLETLAGQHRRVLQETPALDPLSMLSELYDRMGRIEERLDVLEASRPQFKSVPGKTKPENAGD